MNFIEFIYFVHELHKRVTEDIHINAFIDNCRLVKKALYHTETIQNLYNKVCIKFYNLTNEKEVT